MACSQSGDSYDALNSDAGELFHPAPLVHKQKLESQPSFFGQLLAFFPLCEQQSCVLDENSCWFLSGID